MRRYTSRQRRRYLLIMTWHCIIYQFRWYVRCYGSPLKVHLPDLVYYTESLSFLLYLSTVFVSTWWNTPKETRLDTETWEGGSSSPPVSHWRGREVINLPEILESDIGELKPRCFLTQIDDESFGFPVLSTWPLDETKVSYFQTSTQVESDREGLKQSCLIYPVKTPCSQKRGRNPFSFVYYFNVILLRLTFWVSTRPLSSTPYPTCRHCPLNVDLPESSPRGFLGYPQKGTLHKSKRTHGRILSFSSFLKGEEGGMFHWSQWNFFTTHINYLTL